MNILRTLLGVCFLTCMTMNAEEPTNTQESNATRYHDHPMYSMYKDPWRFMEQIFIIEPEQESSKLTTALLKGTIAGVTALPGAVWFLKKARTHAKVYTDDIRHQGLKAIYDSLTKPLVLHGASSLALSLLLPALTYTLLGYVIEKNVDNAMFKNFVLTWQDNYPQTPELFYELFDHIFEIYNETSSDEYLRKMMPEAVTRVREALYEHYPNKYAHKLSQKKRIPAWLKWTIITVGVAATIKLLASATKDIFDVADRVNLAEIKYERQEQGVEENPVDGDDELKRIVAEELSE